MSYAGFKTTTVRLRKLSNRRSLKISTWLLGRSGLYWGRILRSAILHIAAFREVFAAQFKFEFTSSSIRVLAISGLWKTKIHKPGQIDIAVRYKNIPIYCSQLEADRQNNTSAAWYDAATESLPCIPSEPTVNPF
jgi:hypothetical protein